jgi:hypothetical protein
VKKKQNKKIVPKSKPSVWQSIELKLRANPWAYAVIINLLLIFIASQIFVIRFETSDDTGMLLKVSGTSWVQHPTAFISFSHVFIGWTLKTLYTLLPGISWYGMYLISGVFAFFTVLSVILIRKFKFIDILAWYVLFMLLAGFWFIIHLQFTITAWCFVFAGLVLWVYHFQDISNKPWKQVFRNPEIILSIVLIIIGSMIRWRSFLLSLVLFLPVFIALFRFRDLKKMIPIASIVSLVVLSGFALHVLHKYIYHMDEIHKQHDERMPYINQFIDYNILENFSDEEKIDFIKQGGWSPNDYSMLKSWFYLDVNLYSKENAKRILDSLPLSTAKTTSGGQWHIISGLMGKNMSVHLLLIALLGLLMARLPGKTIALLLIVFGLSISLSWYLISFYKIPPPRVFYSFFMLLAILPVVFPVSNSILPKLKQVYYIAGAVAVALILMTKVPGAISKYNETKTKLTNYNTWLHREMQKINPDPANLYIAWTQSFPWEFMLPFDNLGYMKNFRSVNSQYGPSTLSTLREFGISDPYRALVEDPRVFLITDVKKENVQLQLLGGFLFEHYNLRVQRQVIYQNEVFTINKLSFMP